MEKNLDETPPESVDPVDTKSRKRIFYFYNRPVQIRYAGISLFFIVATVLAYSFIIYRSVSRVVGVAQVRTGDSELVGAMAMQNLISAIVWGSLACVIVAGSVSAIWAMLITHRYEGPISRINHQLKELANGNYDGQLVVRKTDEVKTLVENVNELTAALKNRRDKTNS